MGDRAADTTPSAGAPQKSAMEELTKEEVLQKYNKLLSIAKKAKQSKDEFAEENRTLRETLAANETQREADKKALLTMKETLEAYTENKLQLTTQLDELQKKRRQDEEALAQVRIENESYRRQLQRMTEDNDALLGEIDRMEEQLQKVNALGVEQKTHLELLEIEVNKLKEAEAVNASLQSQVHVSQAENKTLKDELNAMTKQHDDLAAQHAEQRQKFKSLKERFLDVHRRLKKLKECKRVLLETQHEYADAVTKWQNEIIEASRVLCDQMNALRTENAALQQRMKGERRADGINVDKMAEQLRELQQLSEHAMAEHRAKQHHLESLVEENKRLKDDLNDSLRSSDASRDEPDEEDSDASKAESVTSLHVLADLHQTLSRCEEEVCALRQENETLRDELKQQEEFQQDIQDVLSELTVHNDPDAVTPPRIRQRNQRIAELETRLRDSAEQKAQLDALAVEKEALQAQLADVTAELQGLKDAARVQDEAQAVASLEAALADSRQSYEELAALHEGKVREHADLLAEMRELNEALKGRGDVISRQQQAQQEAAAQLKQLEQQLCDKEAEVVVQRQATEEAERKVRDHATAEAQRPAEPTAEAAADETDTLSTSTTLSRMEEWHRLRDIDESFEEKYNKLRGLAVKLKQKLQLQTRQIADMEQQQQQQQMDKKPAEEEAEKTSQLAQQLEALRAENQKLKSSRKQANVLNLEIAAAERGLSEATAKLAAKSSEMEALTAALTTKETTIVQLRKEIGLLEAAKASECRHSQDLKAQVDRIQLEIKDAVHSRQEAVAQLKEAETRHESARLEWEAERLQLAKSAGEHETRLAALRDERESLEQRWRQAEATLRGTQASLSAAERALEELRGEYVDYKVKAQAVLRKNNQRRDSAKEREAAEELHEMRANEQRLQAVAEALQRRLDDSDAQRTQLGEEHAALQRQHRELQGVLGELRQQHETLAAENRAQLQLQQEAMKQQRQQIESLEACHHEQLLAAAASHQRQLEALKAEHAQTLRLPSIVGAPRPPPAPLSAEQSKIDFLLMEREDAEGSEEAAEAALASIAAKRKISTASSTRRLQHDFMPLDELLDAPMHTICDTVTTTAGGNGFVFGDAALEDPQRRLEEELQTTKECLQRQETHVRHLSALLAENERDLAKMAQMNDMLKEELRRQERAVEREQHMQNSEYLKNVIVKFLTLGNSDERVRLVPVLNTILKLSRSETEMLHCVAKGQKVSSEGSQRGWGNFLSAWSGGGGGSPSANNNN